LVEINKANVLFFLKLVFFLVAMIRRKAPVLLFPKLLVFLAITTHVRLTLTVKDIRNAVTSTVHVSVSTPCQLTLVHL
jgi:hypothetical protein